jgi:hypothetical protein
MERFFIIGEKSQCGMCFVFFPSDSKEKFCSEICKQAAEEETRHARDEFQREMA